MGNVCGIEGATDRAMTHSPVITVCAKSLQWCLTLWNPMDSPGSSVHGILQARILEWVTMLSSRDLSDPGIELTPPAAPDLQVDSLWLSHWGSPKVQRPTLHFVNESHIHLLALGFAERLSAALKCFGSALYAASWDNPLFPGVWFQFSKDIFVLGLCMPLLAGRVTVQDGRKDGIPLCLFLYPNLLFFLHHHG